MGKSVWRSAWTIALLALASGWAGPGCTQPRDSRFVYIRGESPKPPIHAVDAGIYTLYQADSTVPRFTIYLQPGDPYGFRRREDDSMVAIAKDTEIALGDHYFNSYYWLAPHKNEAVKK